MNSRTLLAPRYVLADLLLTRLARRRGTILRDILLVAGCAGLIGAALGYLLGMALAAR
ncbi:hypothetical protein [Actinoplanes regularis]|uniref:Uncharacterized protein n=1 Tax=Actinoplanes regularis TaxID=52697 RepID=A0A238Z7Q1_9ACTN|nr:hypothetical protein [Actinoplanes regularis]GIE85874.1 hypothetical protein Are01nite_23540 [Actinoplanes regularis]GLW35085.1 hypothetical protein Areg01_80210 [Actinoplanes regularis]SNR79069.1 hypothetical protein SAMN06264365_105486 [Actinoplanes regularis]